MHLGVDLGGTKIELVALEATRARDGAPTRVLRRERVATPGTGPARIVDAVVELVAAAEKELGRAESVGIGTPGSLSPESGLLRNSNTTCLNGQPLGALLERALGRPVRLENDANCFALSEASDGAGAGAEVVFGVILGTGVGGGLVVRGELWRGANGIAGEWGHNPLPWPDADDAPAPACYCGKRGCIESYLSGPALAESYAHATQAAERGLADAPPARDAAAVVARARAGDAHAEACLARYESRLARALVALVHVLDPDVIVLGGGVSNVERWYARVPELWQAHAFADRLATPLVRAHHGDASGVRGAAWLGLQGSGATRTRTP